jgi:DNA-binding winged helix-turn-helix (wHTH) protein/Flp pilus assembly protein TadD
MSDLTFGPFTIDVAANRLLRNGTELRMRPQAFYVLRTLAAHGGRVIDLDQLIREAWGGTAVSRHTVHVTIAEVRGILKDCGSWIVHQPKGGYCLRIPKSDTLIRHGYHFLSLRSREGFERALECFQEAAAEAPRDHRAFEGQGNCHLLMASFGTRPGREMLPAFLQAYERAVALVGQTPELRCNHAHAIHMYERRLPEALSEFDCVIAESPGLSLAHVRKTLLLVTMGNLDAALESAKRAHEADPLMPLTAAAEVNVQLWRREFDAAARIGAQAVQLHPYFMLCRAYYGVALEFSGRLEEALEQYHIGGVVTQGLPWMRALEGTCLVKLGRRSEARAVLNELLARRHTEYIDSYAIARLRHALGEVDDAFVELGRAIDESVGGLYAIRFDPLLDGFRSDRRFTRLLKRYLTPVDRDAHQSVTSIL